MSFRLQLKSRFIISRNKKKNIVAGSKRRFTIVTAVYNCEKYLDDYFHSIIRQNYDIKKISVILVDDGSTDNFSNVVNPYKEYIDIKVISQSNKGQAVARNVGLRYVKDDYVTFIDADDIIGRNYFNHADLAIENCQEESDLFVANLKYYFEKDGKVRDIHKLNYRFYNRYPFHVIDLMKNPDFFVVSMSSAIFKTKVIRAQLLTIRDIKPQFEDTFFVNEYLCYSSKNVCFINNSIYIYRKRLSNDSTIDKVKFDKRRYVSLLNEGYCSLLELYGDIVPRYIKNTVLYDLNYNIDEFKDIEKHFTHDEHATREGYIAKLNMKL